MATYNGEKYIKEQVESIISQLGESDELIISDDQSKDSTISIIESFDDERIKLFIHPTPSTYTSNFENALSKCKGDIIFLSDQDDVWMSNKVEVVKKSLLSGYDLVIHNAHVADENLNIIIPSRNSYYKIKNGFLRNFIKSRYLGCCIAFNRKVLTTVLPFPNNKNLAHHDSWISLVAEMMYKTVVIEEPLIMYRRHSQNTSTGGTTRSSLYQIIKIRVYLMMCLINRATQLCLKVRTT